MPFTLAHPAAVIPLSRPAVGRCLILSALITGSIVPDFGYYVPRIDLSGFSHSLAGVVSFDLLVGLLSLWLFHHILKTPLTLLLPRAHRQRLLPYCTPFPFFPWRRFWLIVFSLLLGALIHLAWDSMTHGWLVQHLPFFQARLLTLAGKPLIVYFVFKHSSTLIGLTLLTYWYWQWFRRQSFSETSPEAAPSSKWRYLVIGSGGLIGIGISGVLLARLSILVGYTEFSGLVKIVATGLGVSALLYSLMFKIMRSGSAVEGIE